MVQKYFSEIVHLKALLYFRKNHLGTSLNKLLN